MAKCGFNMGEDWTPPVEGLGITFGTASTNALDAAETAALAAGRQWLEAFECPDECKYQWNKRVLVTMIEHLPPITGRRKWVFVGIFLIFPVFIRVWSMRARARWTVFVDCSTIPAPEDQSDGDGH